MLSRLCEWKKEAGAFREKERESFPAPAARHRQAEQTQKQWVGCCSGPQPCCTFIAPALFLCSSLTYTSKVHKQSKLPCSSLLNLHSPGDTGGEKSQAKAGAAVG